MTLKTYLVKLCLIGLVIVLPLNSTLFSNPIGTKPYSNIPVNSGKTYLNILVEEVYLAGKTGDLDGVAEGQVMIVATDGDIYSHTSHCPSPPQHLKMRQGSQAKTHCASLGFEPNKLQSPLVFTMMLIDLDEGGIPSEAGAILSGGALAYVSGAALGVSSWTGPVGIIGAIVFDAIISSIPAKFVKYFEEEDVLGEQSILIEPNSPWKTGQVYEIRSNNQQVIFKVHVDLTSTPPGTVVSPSKSQPEQGSETTQSRPSSGSQSSSSSSSTDQSSTSSSSVSDKGKIAFVSDRNGSKDIFIMDVNGKNITAITNMNKNEQTPTWSPDGKKLAFYSPSDGDQEIYIVEVANHKVTQITKNSCADFGPAWSPDGKRIAFYSDCDGNREIYTMNIDGSNRKQLTFTTKTYNWFPTWSPDGNRITYSSNQTGSYYIYVMSADGTDITALARGCISSFSPDGKKIVYAQYCTDYGDIYLMKADGSNARPITSNGNNRNPTWSNDGTKIIYQTLVNGKDAIWVMDANGNNQKPLLSGNGSHTEPVWQP